MKSLVAIFLAFVHQFFPVFNDPSLLENGNLLQATTTPIEIPTAPTSTKPLTVELPAAYVLTNSVNALKVSGGSGSYTYSATAGTFLALKIDKKSIFYKAPQTEGQVVISVSDTELGYTTTTIPVVTPLTLEKDVVNVKPNGSVSIPVTGGKAPYMYSVTEGDAAVSLLGKVTATSSKNKSRVLVTDSVGQSKMIDVIVTGTTITPASLKTTTQKKVVVTTQKKTPTQPLVEDVSVPIPTVSEDPTPTPTPVVPTDPVPTPTPTPDPTPTQVWYKNTAATYIGQYGIDGDPNVLHIGSLYRMFYVCFDQDKGAGIPPGPALCEATSNDGFTFTRVATGLDSGVEGKLLDAGLNGWDEGQEGVFAVKTPSGYNLYFSGYEDKGGLSGSYPIQLGMATSTNGVTFSQNPVPILMNTQGGYDSDGIASPTIIKDSGLYYMIYTAYCYSNCDNAVGSVLMGATSSDGIDWQKTSTPVLTTSSGTSWFSKSLADTELVKGPDGYFYLFVTGIADDDTASIGVMRSDNPFGPWDINPNPILTNTSGGFDAQGTVAPSVIIEDGKVRVWFAGFDDTAHAKIGYAEANWPIYPWAN